MYLNPIRCDLFEYIKTEFAKGGHSTITESTLHWFGRIKNNAKCALENKFGYFRCIFTSIYGGYIEIRTSKPLTQYELNFFSKGMKKYFDVYFPSSYKRYDDNQDYAYYYKDLMDIEQNYYNYAEELRRIESADTNDYKHLIVRTVIDESSTDYVFHLVE